MKIVIRNIFEKDSAVYFLSHKDIDDLDWMMTCLFGGNQMSKYYDEEAEPIGDFKIAVEAIQPDNWKPQVFIEWFNKQMEGEERYFAELTW